jgi:hypothetical protein
MRRRSTQTRRGTYLLTTLSLNSLSKLTVTQALFALHNIPELSLQQYYVTLYGILISNVVRIINP